MLQLLMPVTVCCICIGISIFVFLLISYRYSLKRSENTCMLNQEENILSEMSTVPSSTLEETFPPASVLGFSSSREVTPERLHTSPALIEKMMAVSLYDRVREPEDTTDVYAHPHTKTFPGVDQQNMLYERWQIIGASRRGYGHAYAGQYREDDFHIRVLGEDAVVVAIADGLGSKVLSRRGALAAVMGATSLPEQQLWNFVHQVRRNMDNSLSRELAWELLQDALSAARHAVLARAQQDRVEVDDLHSTLLLFIAVPCEQQRLAIASVQVGDGALFALASGQDTSSPTRWCWLQQPQIQESGNEVQPFMRASPDMWQRLFCYDLLQGTLAIMAMTDGTADDIEPPRPTSENSSPDPFLFVNDFHQRMCSRVLHTSRPEESLLDFLGYRKRGSYDDRTVVHLYHPKLDEGK